VRKAYLIVIIPYFERRALVGFVGGASGTTRYHLVVRGELGAKSAALQGVSIRSADGLTVIALDVRDSSHLCGILDQLRDLSIEVVSAYVVSEPVERARAPDQKSSALTVGQAGGSGR
jgi:hypothetical protein